MANSSKSKGDRAELEAVELLKELGGDLISVAKPMRALGAGRKEDTGDIHVFADTAIQVRNYKLASLGQAVRSSAKDAVSQAGNGFSSYALGMVPYPRATKASVRWLACVSPDWWPGGEPVPAAEFGTISKLADWVRSDEGPKGFLAYPRHLRIGLLTGEAGQVIVAPIEAWLNAYRAELAAERIGGQSAHMGQAGNPALAPSSR
ncbi:hypothetical protein LG293_16495 (plasmid) [Citricoccus nitrophenolicus]